jgi:exosortase A-associated hydrolase 2
VNESSTTAQFIEGCKGPIFVLLRRPPGSVRGCVLVVPPFAEEMNKCRRMVAEATIDLAEHDIACVVPDLYGTGDSGGEFVDADWLTWQDDIIRTVRWVAVQGLSISGILATRLGCALTASALAAGVIGPVERTVLWQPVFDGGRFLQQFLRLRTSASLMVDRKESIAELRTRLRSGEVVEVAGYGLTTRLAADLDAAVTRDRLPLQFGDVTWMEVVRDLGAERPPTSSKLIDQTRFQGGRVDLRLFPGEPFWASTEIVRNREMIDATVQFFAGVGGEGAGRLA